MTNSRYFAVMLTLVGCVTLVALAYANEKAWHAADPLDPVVAGSTEVRFAPVDARTDTTPCQNKR